MSSILKEICVKKAEHVASQKAIKSLSELESLAKQAEAPRGFAKALKNAKTHALIAEVKKASPSKGIIRADFDPEKIASTYEEKGAHCISVLTDEPYFQGQDEYLQAVKKTVNIPVLRKDFMVDPYQIFESRALGADCILIIMAALSDAQAKELHDLALAQGMDALVEVHDAQELERAANLSPKMLGVNNRNLKTLDVNVQTSKDLLASIPDTCIKITESGLADSNTINGLYDAGYKGFLIGESIMREDGIAAKIDNLFPASLKTNLTHNKN